MRILLSFVLLGTAIFLQNCTDESPVIPETEQVVVQAYLYAGEPVTDIRLTSTIPLDVDSLEAPAINDAVVSLVKNGQRYDLLASSGDSGYYHYPGNDLHVETAETFTIEVEYLGQTAGAETVVPAAPENMSISKTVVTVPEFSGGFSGSGFNRDSVTVTVQWDNETSDQYFVVVDNMESDPQAIEQGGFKLPRRFVSRPTNRDNYLVNMFAFTHLGRHRLKLYRVNQEYADLYESRQQDSRDLNEPLTNINNGLGIFSAFNSDSLFFEVKQE